MLQDHRSVHSHSRAPGSSQLFFFGSWDMGQVGPLLRGASLRGCHAGTFPGGLPRSPGLYLCRPGLPLPLLSITSLWKLTHVFPATWSTSPLRFWEKNTNVLCWAKGENRRKGEPCNRFWRRVMDSQDLEGRWKPVQAAPLLAGELSPRGWTLEIQVLVSGLL